MGARTIIIPGEPVAKGRPRATLRGGRPHVYTPATTRDAEARVRGAAERQWDGPAWTGPIRLRVEAFFPVRASWSKRKRAEQCGAPHLIAPDADNIAKLYEDALNGLAFEDDRQVFDVRALKWWAPLPRVEITVTEIAG